MQTRSTPAIAQVQAATKTAGFSGSADSPPSWSSLLPNQWVWKDGWAPGVACAGLMRVDCWNRTWKLAPSQYHKYATYWISRHTRTCKDEWRAMARGQHNG
eukprot:scaffold772_cov339-Pavlova_lutheri.AAC.22